MGNLINEARGEVKLNVVPEQLKPEVGEATIERAPISVLSGVQPWSFPYDQFSRFTAPNIMACNVVMVKHANIAPQCAIASERLWRDTGRWRAIT
jgi:succinate-semialdehyde dehydrogenase / glutarate-semialdehyde dehydrogenase